MYKPDSVAKDFSKGRVSVVIPTYNAASTIVDAVESVLAQTYRDIEIIICDDGSIDDTRQRLQLLSDSRVRILYNDRNCGAGISRNRAIDVSSGRWLAFLDADDQWMPQRLERLVEAAGNDDYAIVFDDIFECISTIHGLRPWRRLRGPKAFGTKPEVRVQDIPSAAWAGSSRLLMKPLVSRAMLESSGVRQGCRPYAEDSEFIFRLLAAGAFLRYVSEPLYLYRVLAVSTSSNQSRHTHMRELLDLSLGWFVDRPDMCMAIRRRLALEVRLEAYFLFLWACRSRHFTLAGRLFFRWPGAISLELMRRFAREAPVWISRLFCKVSK